MARISRQTKEIIQTTAVIVVVIALILVYVIYPLNRVKAVFARPNIDDDSYHNDSLLVNDATSFIEAGLNPDTARIETEGDANLAGVYVTPPADSRSGIPKGTVLLSHREGETRDSLVSMVSQLLDRGWSVFVWDQRASGLSTGKYRGEGTYEAHHIEDIVAHLDIRGRLIHPIVVTGFDRGADGAMIASLEEPRIDVVLAVDPYLTTTRMFDMVRAKNDIYWFPFSRTILWYWYRIRSGYDGQYRDIENLQAVRDKTILYVSPEWAKDEAVVHLISLSDPKLLTAKAMLPTDSELVAEIANLKPAQGD